MTALPIAAPKQIIVFPPMSGLPTVLPPIGPAVAPGETVPFPPLGSGIGITVATVAQMKQALALVDPGGLVKYNIPADPVDTITIGWYEDVFVNSGALYNFIAAQLGYTAAQMSAFYAGLFAYPARP
jgi:hypothetical protein